MNVVANAIKQLVRRKGKDFALDWRLPSLYRAGISNPVDIRKVIFLETEWDYLSDGFLQVKQKLEESGNFDCKVHMLLKNSTSGQHYLRNCEAFVRDAATASFIFLCEASDVVSCLPLRPETKVVQLWHGCGAFKKWGYSTADLKFGPTRAQIDKHPGYRNLSLVTVSSPEVVWAYEEAMGLEGSGVVQPIGVSRTDAFFKDGYAESAHRRLLDAFPLLEGKRLILYAPTFRGDKVSKAYMPIAPDYTFLQKTLGEDTAILVKRHPHVKLADASSFPSVIDVTSWSISDLLAAADVLVTDYSSVIFEYALFTRPMVFFAPDLADYEHERSFYYEYKSFVPGPIVTTTEDLAQLLQDIDAWFNAEQVISFRNKFMSSCDGHSTERILDYILDSSVQ